MRVVIFFSLALVPIVRFTYLYFLLLIASHPVLYLLVARPKLHPKRFLIIVASTKKTIFTHYIIIYNILGVGQYHFLPIFDISIRSADIKQYSIFEIENYELVLKLIYFHRLKTRIFFFFNEYFIDQGHL